MGIYSSGNNYRRAAQGALSSAKALEEEQSDIEFRRQLLSNIRQERIARAQLEVGNYSDVFSSSSAAGATANIDSSLAGETLYSYETSKRAQQIQDYQQTAVNYMKKYKKQQKTRAMSFAVTGMVAGAVLGGIGAAALGAGAATAGGAATGLGIAKGALIGAQIGQGAGQIASGTGQEQQGIQNILSGSATAYNLNQSEENYKRILAAIAGNYTGSYQTPAGYGRYEAISVQPATKKLNMRSTEQFLLPEPNGNTFKGCGGYYS